MGMRFIMALSKAIAAKVAAYYTSWADPEEFAECAEKGIISIQRHYLLPYIRFGFFAILKFSRRVPVGLLLIKLMSLLVRLRNIRSRKK
jgi:hypothetical protein